MKNFLIFPNKYSQTTPDEQSSDYSDDYDSDYDYSTIEGCQSSAAGKSA